MKFWTATKRGGASFLGTPPLETEKGNAFWELPVRREPLLTGFLAMPVEGKFYWGSSARAQRMQL